MRSLPRRVSAVAAGAMPALAFAQADADPAATGRSGWNWVVGLAAFLVVLALARVMFGRSRGAGA
jgi:hypothetical protein